MMATKKHIELVEAVNNSKTELEHTIAQARLDGFRIGLRAAGKEPDLAGFDWHYISQGVDRPTCCGVWLDWEPDRMV